MYDGISSFSMRISTSLLATLSRILLELSTTKMIPLILSLVELLVALVFQRSRYLA